MKGIRQLAALLMAATLALAGCAASSEAAAKKIEPAKVEPLEGSTLNRLVLTPKAVERIGVKTEPVRDLATPGGAPQKTVPYAALIYDTKGETLIYTQTEPTTFVRHPVTVDRIEGPNVFLLDGPEPGTAVVTVGGSELFGIEFGIGK